MVYTHNFLTRVVLRLDFSENLIISNIDEFATSISSIFPIKEEKEFASGSIWLNLKSGETKDPTVQKGASWFFQNADKDKILEVNNNFIYLEYFKYRDSAELISDLKATIMEFLNIFKIKNLKRIGLRYVNEIDLSKSETDHLNWSDYIDSRLISALSFAKQNNQKVARSMGQLYIKETLGDITFNFGVWNADFPNEILRKVFVLDYDCFSKFGVETDQVVETTQLYNKYIENLFEASILEGLRNKMY